MPGGAGGIARGAGSKYGKSASEDMSSALLALVSISSATAPHPDALTSTESSAPSGFTTAEITSRRRSWDPSGDDNVIQFAGKPKDSLHCRHDADDGSWLPGG